MSAVPKKTQQEKFQTILVNLLKEEENKYCADCESKGPRWASWNLGIFLCIRCAGIHRNLGVHISRVKSVNLDSWTPEQLSVMMEIGNGKAKNAYEANLPENFRRPLTDSSLEQFIRQKYEQRKYIPTGWQPPRVNVRAELLENAPIAHTSGRGDRPSTGTKSGTGTRTARVKKDTASGIGAIPAVPSAPLGLNRIADQGADVGVGARTRTLSSSSSDLSTPHSVAPSQPQPQPASQGDLLVSLDDTFGDLVSAPPPRQPAMTPFATAPATAPAPAATPAPVPAATTSVDDLQAVFSAPPVSYSGAPSAPGSGTVSSESGTNWGTNGNASSSSMTNSAILALYGTGAAKAQNGQAFGQTSSLSAGSVQQQLAGLNFGAPAATGGWPPASGTAARPNPFGFGMPEQTASASVPTASGGGQTLISDLWH